MKKIIISITSIALVTAVFLILYLLTNKDTNSIIGKIINITNNSELKSSSILIENEEGPTYVAFNNTIDLRYKNITLSDKVKVITNGIIRESFPPQTTGIDIDLINKLSKIKLDTDLFFLSLPYYENIETSYYIFNTVMFDNEKDFNEFAKNINLNTENLLDIFEEKNIVISYANINSGYTLQCDGISYTTDTLYINLTTNSENKENEVQNLRGIMLILDKDLLKDKEVKTISTHINK